MTLSDLRRMLAPLANRVANMVSRGRVKLVDDAKKIQEIQVSLLDGETRDAVEHIQHYGFTSNPKPDAEAVVAFVGGRRDHGYVLGVDDRRYRICNLESGEVCVYDSTGSKILMKANGDIELTPSSGELVLTGALTVSGTLDVAGATTLSATLDVTGTLTGATINGSEISDGGKILGTHTHSVPATGLVSAASGSPVTGSATSAAPS